MKKKYYFFSDGSFANRIMGFGAFLSEVPDGNDPTKVIWEDFSKVLPRKDSSTSTSEYLGLSTILSYIENNDIPRKRVRIHMDSQFIVRQCQGEYGLNQFNARTGKPNLYYDLGKEVQAKIKELGLKSKNFKWVPRTQNQYADKLSNAYKLENENTIRKIDVASGRLREVREAEGVD